MRQFHTKTASPADVWDRVKDFFRPEARKAKRSVQEHFKAEGPEKWDRFIQNSQSPQFRKQLSRSKLSDPKLLLHAENMGAMQKARVVGNVESQRRPGETYQVKKLPSGRLACTCNDWRYKGSVNPGYKCKHIRAHEKGMNKVASFQDMASGFFDEIQKIRDEQHQYAEEGMKDTRADNARPYSNLLTRGEEPSDYNPNPPPSIEEPEVIVGSHG